MKSDVGWLKSLFIIFLGQSVLIGLFSFFFYYTEDRMTAVSVVSGGLIYCVPTLLAGIFMSRASDESAMLVLLKAYLGTLYKIVITICLFVYVFKNIPINISVFLTAYTITFVAQYVMSYVVHKE